MHFVAFCLQEIHLIGLWSSGIHRKQNLEMIFRLRIDTAVWLLSSPFLLLSCHDVLSVRKAFGNAFRIVESQGRKCGCVVKQHFHQIFLGGWLYMVHCLILQLSWLNCAHSSNGLKDLFPDCTSLITKLFLISKIDDFTSNKRDIDLHMQLWVVQGQIS